MTELNIVKYNNHDIAVVYSEAEVYSTKSAFVSGLAKDYSNGPAQIFGDAIPLPNILYNNAQIDMQKIYNILGFKHD